MRCKVRPYKMIQTNYGLQRFNTREMEIVWDEDIFFPLIYQSEIVTEIMKMAHSQETRVPQLSALESCFRLEQQIMNALPIWKNKYQLTSIRPNGFTSKEKKCGIFIRDQFFEDY